MKEENNNENSLYDKIYTIGYNEGFRNGYSEGYESCSQTTALRIWENEYIQLRKNKCPIELIKKYLELSDKQAERGERLYGNYLKWGDDTEENYEVIDLKDDTETENYKAELRRLADNKY